jgi:hypothetical protein
MDLVFLTDYAHGADQKTTQQCFHNGIKYLKSKKNINNEKLVSTVWMSSIEYSGIIMVRIVIA